MRLQNPIKIIDRFVLKAYSGPMVLTFFIVMFILMVQYLWMYIDDLVGKGLSPGVIMELLMYALVTMIPMGLPLATLLASIMTLGNLGENNELLAMKSAGISLPRIMRPLIILMAVVSIGSFFVINNLTPYSYQKMFALRSDIKKQKREIKFQDGIFFNGIPNFSIRIGHQDGRTNLLNNVLIYNNSDYDKMQTTVADSGYISITEDRKYLSVILYNGQIYEETRNHQWFDRNELSHHMFSEQTMLIPLSGFAFERGDEEAFGTRSETRNIVQLDHDIDSLRHAQDSMVTAFEDRFIKHQLFPELSDQNLDSLPAFYAVSLNGALDTMSIEKTQEIYADAAYQAEEAQRNLDFDAEMLRNTSTQLYRYQGDYQKKLALPFSIMIFFLIGAPLGAIIRKGGLGMPIVVSVGFFVIYYIISIMGEKFVRDGAWPPFWGMWFASLILFPIAIFLTYKSTNDSAIFNADWYKQKFKKVAELYNTTAKKIRGLIPRKKQ